MYAVGGSGGGLTVFMEDGYLVYEYNMMIIENYRAKSTTALPAGKHRIEVTTRVEGNRPGASGSVSLVVDGEEVAKIELRRTVPLVFTVSDTFDVGVDLGSTVSLDYYDRRPFPFSGTISSVDIRLQ